MRDTKDPHPPFDLEAFLPYLLNQAAETTGKSFGQIYRAEYGMTRTQWRVMANLGKFGAMSAAEICRISHTEKTKVSRAVAALEAMGFLQRHRSAHDRRREDLSLTEAGRDAFAALGRSALDYDRGLRDHLGPEAARVLESALRALIVGTQDPARDGGMTARAEPGDNAPRGCEK